MVFVAWLQNSFPQPLVCGAERRNFTWSAAMQRRGAQIHIQYVQALLVRQLNMSKTKCPFVVSLSNHERLIVGEYAAAPGIRMRL